QQNLTRGLYHLGTISAESGPDLGDLTAGDQHVDRITFTVEPYALDQHRHEVTPTPSDPAPTSRWNNTAIRTCTPLETCCSTADCVESATENAISIPRPIGRGGGPTALPGSIACRFSDSP